MGSVHPSLFVHTAISQLIPGKVLRRFLEPRNEVRGFLLEYNFNLSERLADKVWLFKVAIILPKGVVFDQFREFQLSRIPLEEILIPVNIPKSYITFHVSNKSIEQYFPDNNFGKLENNSCIVSTKPSFFTHQHYKPIKLYSLRGECPQFTQEAVLIISSLAFPMFKQKINTTIS